MLKHQTVKQKHEQNFLIHIFWLIISKTVNFLHVAADMHNQRENQKHYQFSFPSSSLFILNFHKPDSAMHYASTHLTVDNIYAEPRIKCF